ncbi:hypothetical protein [Sulfurimonas marina]|uniref:hypothetical protein n=1 Tax=Sulfurimonas marina TaxID=2590551 RepID=UPI001D038365|nr:hypothetical protein [Sulfurimonas marina]
MYLELIRKKVCPNIEAGEFICAAGKTKVAEVGESFSIVSSYSWHFTSGKSLISSFSCSQAFLAGNLHADELSSKRVSLKSASSVASSSASAFSLPFFAKKNLGSSISLTPPLIWSKRCQ